MRNYTILLSCIAFVAYVQAADSTMQDQLPWSEIAEQMGKDSVVCCDVGSSTLEEAGENYVFKPGERLTTTYSGQDLAEMLSRGIEVEVAKLVGDSWQSVGQATATVHSGLLNISNMVEDEGFFWIRAKPDIEGSNGRQGGVYAIICENWKSNIIRFCLDIKNRIESNCDDELVRSSIAVSHIDHAMEMVSDSAILSRGVLFALSGAVRCLEDFEEGRYPDLVVGGLTNIRLRRFAGARVTEFVVCVPPHYDPSQKWPVTLYVAPRRPLSAEGYLSDSGWIDIWWHFPLPQGFEWKDYLCLLDVVKRKLSIDFERMYLDGKCGNGIATMALALSHPDRWAESGFTTGNSYRHLAGNALNLPAR